MNKLITILSLLAFSASAQLKLPSGWIKPKNELFKTEWINSDHSKHLSIGADFDNNGLIDSALF